MFYGYKDFMTLTFTTKFSKNNAFIHFAIEIFSLNYNIRLWCLIIKHWVWFLLYFLVRSYAERWHNFVRTFHFVFALFLSSTDCCLVEKTENSELTWLNSSTVCYNTVWKAFCTAWHKQKPTTPNSLRR